MKIIQLEAQNVKKLKAIEIRPDGNVIVIGGKNGAGKTSVLDSIAYAMSGKSSIPSQPVRKGKKKATIICDLGDLIVKRTMTANGGGSLTVENKEGAVFKSPQAILDALTGELTFDPLEFSNMDGRKQVETLKGLVGLDFTKLDNERLQAYDERTTVNTEGKRLKAQFEGMQEFHIDAPKEEVSVSELMAELLKREKINDHNTTHRHSLNETLSGLDDLKLDAEDLKEQIKDIQDYLKDVESDIKRTEKQVAIAKPQIKELKDVDEKEVRDQIDNAETVNQEVRSNQDRKALSKQLEARRKESAALTTHIQEIDESKAKQLSEAKFPVPGLSFSSEEVLYDDLPFGQASSAEQLRVSVAMGFALNPKLGVLLIRGGSLLDEDNLALIAKMAEEADGQVWIEVVGKGKECQVIIEDGQIEKGE